MSCCEIGDLLKLDAQGMAVKGIARKASDVHHHGAPVRYGDAHFPAELIKLAAPALALPLANVLLATRARQPRSSCHGPCTLVARRG